MPMIDVGLNITGINNASGALRSIIQDINGVGDASEKAGAKMRTFGENAQATANRLKAIQVVIAGILIEKSLELGKAFLEASSNVQNLDTRMAAWAGGTQQAQAILAKFNADLGASGVKLEAMGNAFVKLRSSGASNNQAQQTITNMVSGIAALGGTDIEGKLDAAATSFQRFTSKGLVASRELNAVIGETGITVKDLADAAGESVKKFYEDLQFKSTRAITFLNAFNKAAQEKFGGFVTLLGSTVGGALSQFKNDFEHALGDLGKETGLNNNITAQIQILDKAVIDFLKHLKPEEVNDFVNKLRELTTAAINTAVAVVPLATAVFNLGTTMASVLNAMPPEVLQYGFIGYLFGGKTGALIGGGLAEAFTSAGSYLDKVSAAFGRDMPDSMFGPKAQSRLPPDFRGLSLGNPLNDIEGIINILTGAAQKVPNNPKNTVVAKVLGTPDYVKLITDAVVAGQAALAKFKFTPNGITEGAFGKGNSAQIAAQIAALKAEADASLSEVSGKVNLLAFKNSGDELNAALQTADNTVQKTIEQLTVLKSKIDTSKLSTKEKANYDDEILGLMMRETAEGQKQDVIIKAVNVAKLQELAITTQIAEQEARIHNLAAQQTINGLSSAAGAFTQGLGAAQTIMEVERQQLEYTKDIYDYEQKIEGLKGKIAAGASGADLANDNAQIAALQSQIAVTQRLAQVTTVSASQMSAAYKQLGQTIENDVGNGIAGVINGTETWRDLGKQLFGDLVSWAVKYMLQLIEIQAIKLVFGSTADITGAAALTSAAAALAAASIPLDGSAAALSAAASELAFANGLRLGAFAKGGVFEGQVTPFANGGITTGPTLFGLMGEAGTEAIMPLTRIGGKLGVHATGGGGGNHYHINVSAIDTQSGLQFLAQNIKAIDAGLNQSRRLNGRAGHY